MVWKYILEQGGVGIVLAENESEAINKVYLAYSDHNGNEPFGEEITVRPIENGWFLDHPDVIEVCY